MGSRLRLQRLAAAVITALVIVLGGSTAAQGKVAPEPSASTASAPPPSTLQPSTLQPSTLARDGPAAQGTAPATGWAWPLQPRPAVLARFDPPDVAWGAGHRGVDLAASVGQEVLAPATGTVTFDGVVVDREVVVVTMASGLRATFEPVAGTVTAGVAVTRGQVIGHVTDAPGHCAPAVCLHWGVLRGDTYVDPLVLVGRRPVVLLPLAPP